MRHDYCLLCTKKTNKKLKIVHLDNKSHPMCYNTDIQDNARREEVAGYDIYFPTSRLISSTGYVNVRSQALACGLLFFKEENG